MSYWPSSHGLRASIMKSDPAEHLTDFDIFKKKYNKGNAKYNADNTNEHHIRAGNFFTSMTSSSVLFKPLFLYICSLPRENLNWQKHPTGSEICHGRDFSPEGWRDCSSVQKIFASILIITIKIKIFKPSKIFVSGMRSPTSRKPAWEQRGGDGQSCWRSGRVLRGVDEHRSCYCVISAQNEGTSKNFSIINI